MSRSFQVITEKNPDFTIKEILNTIKTLRDSDKEIDFKNIRINHSGTSYVFVTEDCIVHINFHTTEWDGKIHKWWHIESRALYGMGKSLFVACASAVAILTDGYASSCDGAFIISDTKFTGHELWKTHLDIQSCIIVETMHGKTIFRSKDDFKKIILNMYDYIRIYSESETKYPQLNICVNGNYAFILYSTGEKTFRSVGDVNKKIIFNRINEEPEASVTLDDAIMCTEIFFDTLSRPECIEWTEF
ncbi:MAG: hypothetical protein K2J32_04980 [Ruminococcus sp.]|nr:hypothetical protein [Ruminococcus sp.]